MIDRYAFKTDSSGYLNNLRDHLYLFDVATKKSEALTTGVYSEAAAVWSPDGTRIAFISERGTDPDRTNNPDLWVVGREARRDAAAAHDVRWARMKGGPAWSPDGRMDRLLAGR